MEGDGSDSSGSGFLGGLLGDALSSSVSSNLPTKQEMVVYYLEAVAVFCVIFWVFGWVVLKITKR